MSTKSGIYYSEEANVYLYESALLTEDVSPAFIEVSGVGGAKVDIHCDEYAL